MCGVCVVYRGVSSLLLLVRSRVLELSYKGMTIHTRFNCLTKTDTMKVLVKMGHEARNHALTATSEEANSQLHDEDFVMAC